MSSATTIIFRFDALIVRVARHRKAVPVIHNTFGKVFVQIIKRPDTVHNLCLSLPIQFVRLGERSPWVVSSHHTTGTAYVTRMSVGLGVWIGNAGDAYLDGHTLGSV